MKNQTQQFSLALICLSCMLHASVVFAQSQQARSQQAQSQQAQSQQAQSQQAQSQQAQSQQAQSSQSHYMFQGKEISKEYFDALNLAREAEPFMHTGDFAKAEPILKKAVEGAPDNADICCNYALALMKTAKAKDAIEYYRKASVLAPNLESVWIGWSGAYGALGQLDDSLNVCKEFLKRFPHSVNYAVVENQARTIEKELKHLNKAASANASGAQADNYFAVAFVSEAHRWNSSRMPLAVYIESGEKAEKWQPSYNDILRKCFQDWAEASNGMISFRFVESPKSANISCAWTDDLKQLKNTAEQGETDTSWADNNELTRAKIKLLTISSVNRNMQITEEKIKQTALHEIGHALGIAGHSGNPDDIMYFASINVESPHLSTRDAKTLQMLYEPDQAK